MYNHFYNILKHSTESVIERKPHVPYMYKEPCFYIIRCEYLLFWTEHMVSALITFYLIFF